MLSVGRDVTERHVAEQRLAESEARFRDLADKSSDIVWHITAEPTPHFDYLSPSVENMLGYPPEYFLADFTRVLDILDDNGRRAIDLALRGERPLGRMDFHLRHADGSIVIGETLTTVVQDAVQGVTRDVTELRRLQDRLAALALRDPLTGLANRRLLDELLDAELARTQRSEVPLAVAYIDLDGLKQVNDTYGHDAGDMVLCETARRLVAIVRGADVVARLGRRRVRRRLRAERPELRPSRRPHRRRARRADRDRERRVVACPASIGTADTRHRRCHARSCSLPPTTRCTRSSAPAGRLRRRTWHRCRMRIVISEFISLDGVVQAPGGAEEDTDGGFRHGGWSMPFFDPEVMGSSIGEVAERTDALLYGRRTWQVMAGAWPDRAGDPFADWINAAEKHVVSDTLTEDDLTWAADDAHPRRRPGRRGQRARAIDRAATCNVMGSARLVRVAARGRPRRRDEPDDRADRARRRQEHLPGRRRGAPVRARVRRRRRRPACRSAATSALADFGQRTNRVAR